MNPGSQNPEGRVKKLKVKEIVLREKRVGSWKLEENMAFNSNIASDTKCLENVGLTIQLFDTRNTPPPQIPAFPPEERVLQPPNQS